MMKGRTRGIIEDLFVLIILVLLGSGGYIFFFSGDTKELPQVITTENTLTNNDLAISTEKQKATNTTQIEKEVEITEAKEELLKSVEELETKVDSIKTQKVEAKEESVEKETSSQENQKLEIVQKQQEVQQNTNLIKNKPVPEKVDLKKLQQFLIDTKAKIRKSLVLETINNEKKQSSLSIRITVLKNGTYEQLILTGGDKKLFENNLNNIKNIFPLKIDENIEAEFPRYLRYKFQFTHKDQ